MTGLVICWATHFCAGCGEQIAPGTEHLDHTRQEPCQRCADAPEGTTPAYHGHVVELVSECLACARRNGRLGIADPETPEQPLDLEGIA